MIALSDNGSALVHPRDAIYSKLNYVGGNNWSTPGQRIFWKVNVPKSGYYSICFNYRQSYNAGSVSYRNLQVDGRTPFAEAARIKFAYNSAWEYMTFSNENNTPYYIYLEQGESVISLSTTGGELCELYSSLQEAASMMGDLYVDITKVVGETVDIYRSYELFNMIPNFNDRLDEIILSLKNIAKQMKQSQGNQMSSSVSLVNEALRTVELMRNNKYRAHKYKSQFYKSYDELKVFSANNKYELEHGKVDIYIGTGDNLPLCEEIEI